MPRNEEIFQRFTEMTHEEAMSFLQGIREGRIAPIKEMTNKLPERKKTVKRRNAADTLLQSMSAEEIARFLEKVEAGT